MNLKIVKFLSCILVVIFVVSLSITVGGCKEEAVESVEKAVEETEGATEEVAGEAEEDETNMVIFNYTSSMEDRKADLHMFEYAVDKLEERNPNVKVDFQLITFEQLANTSRIILDSDEAPDVMEVNSGPANEGLFATSDLLMDLTEEYEERGWDENLKENYLFTNLYDENGKMGSGNLYGIPYFGEYIGVYYNKDMFSQFGLEVPNTLEEFEAICDTFVENGITPLTEGGLDSWSLICVWWEFVLYNADKDFISDWYSLENPVNFDGEALAFGAQKISEYAKKGYFSTNINGVSLVDAIADFLQGNSPMHIGGSYSLGQIMEEAGIDWGIFLLPEKKYYTGCVGPLNQAVPAKAKHKDLGLEFLDILLDEDSMTYFASEGGLPVYADLSKLEDKKLIEFNQAFSTIGENDGFGYYPDWAATGLLDIMERNLQLLFDGTMSPEEYNNAISETWYADYNKIHGE